MAKLQDFSIKPLLGDGNVVPEVAGKVVLAVNVASKCGLTPQYQGLQELYEDLGDKGLAVVGFPCNQFGKQEPGTAAEIVSFCTVNYDVTFPLTEKIEVNGSRKHPIYAWLQKEFPGDIEWNFGKFLIDRKGKVIRRYPPQTAPNDPVLLADISEAL